MQFVRLNGAAHHYQLIGAPEGRPLLVLVNSLGTDFRIWRDLVVKLAGEFAILTYDARGHGLTDVGETPYSMAGLAGDLAALLDHLGVRRAVVCGVSVGGMIAQALYAARPELVGALVLCDTAPRIGTHEAWTARIETVGRDGIAAVAEAIVKGWFTPAFHAGHAAEVAGYRNMLVRQPVAGYVATCVALRDADLTALAPRIGAPTLCVVGETDPTTTPAMVAACAKLIPGARFELIRNAGHIPSVEQPAVLAEIIRAFLARPETELTSNVSH
jgi:3-oxoadipate enol-lactonase